MAAIDGVVQAHHAALSTITFLKEKVQALEGHNQGLTARVAVLEQSSRCRLQQWVGRRRVADGVVELLLSDIAELAEKKMFDDEQRAANQLRMAKEIRAAEEKRAEEKRAAEEKQAAQEKRAAEEKSAAEEKRAAQEKRVKEKRAAEEKLAAQEKRAAEEKRAAQEKRVAEDKRTAEEKLIEDKRAEEKRVMDRCADLLNSEFPLHEASKVGDSTDVLDRLMWLFHHHVDCKNGHGRTPLHYAAWNGHTNTVEHLLSRGAEINSKDSDGRTPLRMAKQWGRTNVVELLKSKEGTV